jgi:hypothetical protein
MMRYPFGHVEELASSSFSLIVRLRGKEKMRNTRGFLEAVTNCMNTGMSCTDLYQAGQQLLAIHRRNGGMI